MPCHSIFIYGDGISLVNRLSSTTMGISLVNRFITFRAQLIHIWEHPWYIYYYPRNLYIYENTHIFTFTTPETCTYMRTPLIHIWEHPILAGVHLGYANYVMVGVLLMATRSNWEKRVLFRVNQLGNQGTIQTCCTSHIGRVLTGSTAEHVRAHSI